MKDGNYCSMCEMPAELWLGSGEPLCRDHVSTEGIEQCDGCHEYERIEDLELTSTGNWFCDQCLDELDAIGAQFELIDGEFDEEDWEDDGWDEEPETE